MDTELILCPIYRWSREKPDQVAIYTEEMSITYSMLNNAVTHAASKFRTIPDITSSIVTFTQAETIQTIVMFFALIRLRATCLILSPKSPPQYVSDVMEKAGSSIRLDEQLAIDFEPCDLSMGDQAYTNYYSSNQWVHVVPTSGSSGSPKLVTLSLNNYLASCFGSQSILPVEESSIWLLVLPLSHVSGMSILFRCFTHGASISLSDQIPSITHASFVVTQLKKHLDQHASFLKTIRYILLGGSRIPEEIISLCHAKKISLFTTYGMSEATSQIATLGTCLPHMHVKIKNGVIWFKGDSLFEGYLENGFCTIETDSEGYFCTEDKGDIIDDKLVVYGRSKRMFISGGENIYPEEIESRLNEIVDIDVAVIINVPDDTFQEKAIAFISPYSTVLVEKVKMMLRKKLPAYKIPKEFLPFPKNMLQLGIKTSYSNLRKDYLDTFLKK